MTIRRNQIHFFKILSSLITNGSSRYINLYVEIEKLSLFSRLGDAKVNVAVSFSSNGPGTLRKTLSPEEFLLFVEQQLESEADDKVNIVLPPTTLSSLAKINLNWRPNITVIELPLKYWDINPSEEIWIDIRKKISDIVLVPCSLIFKLALCLLQANEQITCISAIDQENTFKIVQSGWKQLKTIDCIGRMFCYLFINV